MADETKAAPVTDSRFPGFNAEVEESHAAAAAAAGAPAPAPAPAPVKPKAPRAPGNVMVDLIREICDELGNKPRFAALLAELKGVLPKEPAA